MLSVGLVVCLGMVLCFAVAGIYLTRICCSVAGRRRFRSAEGGPISPPKGREVLTVLRLLLCLSAAVIGIYLLRMYRSEPPTPVEKVGAPGRLPREVKGYGLTVEKAREDARQQAATVLAIFLAQHDPLLLDGREDEATRKRLENYVHDYLAAGAGQQLEDIALDQNPPSKVWSLPLKSDPDWGAIIRVEQAAQRHLRVRARQLDAARLTAALSLLLGAGLVYARVKRWRRGVTHRATLPGG
jgi:hypothetical protein